MSDYETDPPPTLPGQEFDPNTGSPSRLRKIYNSLGTIIVVGVSSAGFLAAAYREIAAKSENPRMSREMLEWELTNIYRPGSVKLTSAVIDAYGRAVSLHIDSKENKELTSGFGDKEPKWGPHLDPVGLTPSGSSGRCVVHWDKGQNASGNAKILVSGGSDKTTSDYKCRLYLLTVADYGGRDLNGLYYAGTIDVEVTGDRATRAQIEYDPAIPAVRVVQLPDGQSYRK